MEQISLYGTISVFCDNSLESIHAIVNLVARIYSMTPAKECAGLVFKTLHAQKQGKCSVNVDMKMEKSKKKLLSIGNRKRQGKYDSRQREIELEEPSHVQQLVEGLNQSY